MFTALIVVLLLIALGIGGWLLRGYLMGYGAGASLMGSAREKRVGVVEQAAVDGRRKLVLVRRDGMEHLIMTGGPIDLTFTTSANAGATTISDNSADITVNGLDTATATIPGVDVVIETGIKPHYHRSASPALAHTSAHQSEPEREPPGFQRVRQPMVAQGSE